MKNLTGAQTSFPTVVRCPTNADARNAASVEVGLQDLADRTSTLKSQLDHLDGVRAGAKRLRSVASLSALRAIALADRSDGELRYVSRRGMYFYAEAALDATDDFLVVRPADIGSDASAGRWIHEHADLLGTRLRKVGTSTYEAAITVTSSTFVQYAIPTVTLPSVEIGDRVVMHFSAHLYPDEILVGDSTYHVKPVITRPATGEVDAGFDFPVQPAADGGNQIWSGGPIAFTSVYTATEPGSHVALIRHRSGATGNAWVISRATLVVEHYRGV